MSRSQLILVNAPPSIDALRREYIATLTWILRTMGERCAVDADLAERIARLLDQMQRRPS